ncbi:hypothetical protein GMC29_06610 [Streptococcus salivarius]|jgi:hypothetical protein|uniref:hypothetical protein n=1 Tax=Streptococcus salivarius TaxID=1304 RepID=UPI0012BD07C0|nr:hypothetical protein [Streptococcus salivarius]MTR26009.1 hypothetical protein [Streptococcus salivarius]UVY22220.1 MAG: Protein of unknown function (DUF2536) [Bacteriophage sp.]
MKRKVKIFSDSDTDKGLDETINKWIEENRFELIDVRVDCNIEMNYGIVRYTATVIYTDRSGE